MDDSYRTPSAVAQSHNMMFREALLSYRLLFGQDERSRKLYNAHEIGPAGVDDQQQPDGLLMRLCGGKERLSSLISDDSIHEKDVYDTAADFPFYSERLIRIKEFAESIRAHHGIRSLWYDGRWLKEWVLACMIGGVNILWAIVEISLAIAQAVLYVHRGDGR
ncbi:MAG: hypothetical protein Q9202_005394 [Teloschistes flavicans]